MGLIGRLVETLKGQAAVDFILTGALPVMVDGMSTDSRSQLLGDDECYVEIFIEAIWLPKARKVTGFYHGVVHAFSALQRDGGDKARVAFVSSPLELSKLDPKSIGKILTRSQLALGPIPWRGGTLDLEIGLFSIKSYDLTRPFLDMITAISEQAGVSFVAQAASFMPLIRKGIELMTEADGTAALEIGLDINIVQPATGCYALIAGDRGEIKEHELSVDGKDRRLLLNGQTYRDHPWLIFRIAKSDRRADFGTVPDLADAWNGFRAAVKSRKRKDAEDALTYFRVTAFTSPDLIHVDAERLAKKAEEMMKSSFAGVMQSKDEASVDLPDLSLLGI